MRPGRIHQISVSRGGVPKLPVPRARIARDGMVGDSQSDRFHHGGPDRAVCLFSLEVIRRLQSEGHPIQPGTAGENLTVEGLDWGAVRPGARLAIGDADPVELEIAAYTTPCSSIRNSFADLNSQRIKQDLHPGASRVYARVIREGTIRVGDPCRLITRP